MRPRPVSSTQRVGGLGRGGGGRYPNTGTTTDTPHGEDLLNITEVFKKTTPPSTEILKPLSGSTEHDMD